MTNINITWRPSVANAPSNFQAVVEQAAANIEAICTGNTSVNIDVGWDEVQGQQLPPGVLGESEPNFYIRNFSQVHDALVKANPGFPIPSTDPSSNGVFVVMTALDKALGLSPDSTAIDGSIGLAVVLVSVAEHEISEVMGRIILPAGDLGPYDLYDYKAQGQNSYVGTDARYLSVDGGATPLNSFNSNPVGDFGDWAGATPDAFNAIGTGSEEPMGPSDPYVFKVLAYAPSVMPPPPPPPPPPTPPTCTISASPSSLSSPGNTTLTWSSQFATSAVLNGMNVPVAGSMVFPVSVPTTFVLTVTGPGGSAQASVFVNVRKPHGKPPKQRLKGRQTK